MVVGALVAAVRAVAAIVAGTLLWATRVLDAAASSSVALVVLTLDALFLAAMASWFALQSAIATKAAITPLARLVNLTRAQECREDLRAYRALEVAVGRIEAARIAIFDSAAYGSAKALYDANRDRFPSGSLPDSVESLLRESRPGPSAFTAARADIRNRIEAIERELRALEPVID
jgi:hypothetical protein